MDLKQKAAQGLFWGGVSNVVQQLLNIAFGIYLARSLSQSDYGTVATLTIFSAVANAIQESGFRSAITNRKDVTHQDYNSVFWTSLGLGALLYIALFFSAPLIAGYFQMPELVSLSRFVFLGFLISSTGVAHNAFLFKNLMTKQIAKATLIASVVSGVVAVSMALMDMAYWAIAAQNVAYIFSITAMFWVYSGFRPRLRYSFQPIREMLPYSSKLLITTIFHLLNENFLTAFMVKFFSKPQAGLYYNGYKWQNIGTQTISLAIENVMQPVMSKADKGSQLPVFCKLLEVTCFISLPCMLGLGLISPEIIPATIGDKWLGSVAIMQVLCVWGAVFPLCQVYQKQLLSAGRSGTVMACVITRFALQFAMLICFYRYGILPMVMAFTASNVLSVFQAHYYVRKVNGVTCAMLFRSAMPYLAATLISLAAGYMAALPFDNLWIRLIAKIAAAALSYAGILWLSGNGLIREAAEFLRGFVAKK